MLAHAFNPRTPEKRQADICKFQASQSKIVRPCLKKINKPNVLSKSVLIVLDNYYNHHPLRKVQICSC